MNIDNQFVYVFWTCRDRAEAKKIICELLDNNLIACASIIPEVESMYRWKGKIEESIEVKVILKTLKKYFEEVEQCISSRCTYEVPEIVQLAVQDGYKPYLSWIIESLN